jgi:hypothetical protein
MSPRQYAQQQVQVLEKTKCFKCLVDLDPKYDTYLSLHVRGGYGSKQLGDSVEADADVCEACLVEWLDTFKLKPYDNTFWDIEDDSWGKENTNGNPILQEADGASRCFP